MPEAPTTVAYRMQKKPMEKGKTTSLYTRTLSTTTRKEKKKNSCKAQPMENTELKKKTNTDVKLSADNKYGTLPTK